MRVITGGQPSKGGNGMMNRRRFLGVTASAYALAHFNDARAAGKLNIKLGAMGGCVMSPVTPEVFALARRIGLDGVELNIGTKVEDGKLPLADAETCDKYRAGARANQLAIAGVVLDILHRNPLKDDPLAPGFVAQGVDIARLMNARVLLIPIFGKGALKTREEMDRVGDILKEHARAAEKANLLLGLEDTISAEDNVRIMERIGSPAVRTYYDVGNSTNNGFDVLKEIRWLGGRRICQIHLKDQGYLGEGKIDFRQVFRTIRDSGYEGFANFETSAPSKDREADLRRNLLFTRKIMAEVEAGTRR